MIHSIREKGFGFVGVVMVVAAISLMGLVAFRFLDAQNTTEVANETTLTSKPVVAAIQKLADIDSTSNQLDDVELDSVALDAELDAELDF